MMVELEQELRLGLLAGKAPKLLQPISRLRESAADVGGSKQARQQGETLRRSFAGFRQLLRAKINPLRFRGGPSLGDHQHRAERGLGGKERNKHADKRHGEGRGTVGKQTVWGAL